MDIQPVLSVLKRIKGTGYFYFNYHNYQLIIKEIMKEQAIMIE